jgi:signal transduction histidine kinase
MLTSAQIASERLAALGDPKVSQVLPRLERALDRAVKLATDVLAYGKTEEAAPVARPTPLIEALEMAAEEARLSPEGVRLSPQVPANAQVQADPDQLHRILANLMRNARQAIEAEDGARDAPGVVRVELEQTETTSLIRLIDNGPGVSERARERLFQPFAGSSRPGGAGLGLAIARELAQGHGGDLSLAETGPGGSTFEIRLPGAPPSLTTPRRRTRKATQSRDQ